MQINDALSGLGVSSGTNATSSSQLGEQDFFTLLTAQLRSQNPLEPMDDQQFLSELAQFSSLEQLSSVNDNLTGLAIQQEQLRLLWSPLPERGFDRSHRRVHGSRIR